LTVQERVERAIPTAIGRLRADLGGESFDGLQVKVEVEVKVVEVLAVDEEVEHVVALAADLQTDLNPVQCRCLEELGRFERPEQIPARITDVCLSGQSAHVLLTGRNSAYQKPR